MSFERCVLSCVLFVLVDKLTVAEEASSDTPHHLRTFAPLVGASLASKPKLENDFRNIDPELFLHGYTVQERCDVARPNVRVVQHGYWCLVATASP
ncbi:hypothetical protein BU23DRAFT_555817 [Bimuria novae-zelandiae CBS 107.79]|uniref:Secreted protein n=1 Tax=Bimuria novae-zelandiae CBS 107.79 TaxID=1447943 RepID=A0A6A5V6I0_9PLEO|nr:hypothetical protein BU23DRAFT_555817 [Bimuria novae-zelandiae CBS 107.79]